MASPSPVTTGANAARPPLVLIAAIIVALIVIGGAVWYWRSQAATAAEAVARVELEKSGVIVIQDGGHVKTLNSMQKMDDALFANVGQLTHLHTCVLSSADITDGQMAVLGMLPKLGVLVVDKSPGVTSAGLAHLQGMNSLEKLFANETSIDDAGMAHLSGLPNLTTLDISHTKVTDAGLEPLTTIPRLEVLRLCGNDITDAGVESLKAMESLKLLNVAGTKLTAEGIKSLRAARKDLVVEESE